MLCFLQLFHCVISRFREENSSNCRIFDVLVPASTKSQNPLRALVFHFFRLGSGNVVETVFLKRSVNVLLNRVISPRLKVVRESNGVEGKKFNPKVTFC